MELQQRKKYPLTNDPLTSITFTPSGSHFITTSPSSTLHLFDQQRPIQTINSKKYGCTAATFTQRGSEGSIPQSCIIASTIPIDNDVIKSNAIRSLDIKTNSFLRYFNGHISQVISMETTPWSSEGFISSSIDGQIRLWDNRINKSVAMANISNYGEILVMPDPTGLVIAIWYNFNNKLIISSVGDFPEGLIGELTINSLNKNEFVCGLKFTIDGKVLLDLTSGEIIVIDTLKMEIIGRLIGRKIFVNSNANSMKIVRSTPSIDITPDGHWVIGSGEGIWKWHLKDLKIGGRLKGEIIDNNLMGHVVSINPRFNNIAIGDSNEDIIVYTY